MHCSIYEQKWWISASCARVAAADHDVVVYGRAHHHLKFVNCLSHFLSYPEFELCPQKISPNLSHKHDQEYHLPELKLRRANIIVTARKQGSRCVGLQSLGICRYWVKLGLTLRDRNTINRISQSIWIEIEILAIFLRSGRSYAVRETNRIIRKCITKSEGN